MAKVIPHSAGVRAEDNDPTRADGQVLTTDRDLQAARELGEARRVLMAEIGKRIVGQADVVDHLLIALFARGHCLFVGVPGLAKTLLIQTLADVLDLSFGRIQFTPDLMPSDITGSDVLEEDRATGRRVFRFVRGPAVRQRHPGRRGEPHAAQDPGGAAAVDAGVPGVGRRVHLRAAAAVPGVRHPEPDRAGGHLPAARGAAGPLHVPDRRGLPLARRRRCASSARPRPPTARRCARCCRPSGSWSCRTLVLRVPVADHVLRHAVALCRATRPGRARRRQRPGPDRPSTATSSWCASTSPGARGRAPRST